MRIGNCSKSSLSATMSSAETLGDFIKVVLRLIHAGFGLPYIRRDGEVNPERTIATRTRSRLRPRCAKPSSKRGARSRARRRRSRRAEHLSGRNLATSIRRPDQGPSLDGGGPRRLAIPRGTASVPVSTSPPAGCGLAGSPWRSLTPKSAAPGGQLSLDILLRARRYASGRGLRRCGP